MEQAQASYTRTKDSSDLAGTNVRGFDMPFNEMAEKIVLGTMILYPACITQVRTILNPDSFYIPRHVLICQTIYAMEEASDTIDFSSVIAELSSRGHLDSVGGVHYLIHLQEFVFSIDSAEQNARTVLEKHQLRQLVSALNHSVQQALTTEHARPIEIIEATQDTLHQLGLERTAKDFRSLKEVSGTVVDDIASRRANEGNGVSGLRTGLRLFDEKTGGLQKSDLIILAARPSVGKTAFALNLAVEIGTGRAYHKRRSQFSDEHACGVGIFSLEMSEIQVMQRMLSTVSGISMYLMRTGGYSTADFDILSENASQLAKCPIYIDDTAGISISELRAKALRLKKRCERDAEISGNPNRNLSMLIIDYLQLMRGRTDKKQESRQQEVSEISRSIKELARELNIPIIALSQLSRAIEQRKGKNSRPQLSDLRESGAIEQDADVVLFLHRDKELDQFSGPNAQVSNIENAQLIIGKQRNGPIGTIELFFTKSIATFSINNEADFDPGT